MSVGQGATVDDRERICELERENADLRRQLGDLLTIHQQDRECAQAALAALRLLVDREL